MARRQPAEYMENMPAPLDAKMTANGIPPHGRRVVIIALLASVFSFSISFGGIVPWMALVLESRDTDPFLVGVVTAANPIGVMLMAPFVSRLTQRFGLADSMILSGVVGVVTIALLPVIDGVAAWIVLRLINGLAGAIPWVVTETWINVVAGNRSRGRVIALYGMVLSVGYASGPLTLGFIGIDGFVPIIVFATLSAVSLAPVFTIRRFSPTLSIEAGSSAWTLLVAMPTVFAAAFLSGAVDTSFFTFLPIWGLRVGLDPTFSIAILSIFIVGNVALQVPAGWLADRIGSRPVMAICGIVCVGAPFLAYAAIDAPILLAAVLFLWGGSAWATYTLGLIEIGHRCQGTRLTQANSLFVLVYTIANISAPPLSGVAMQLWDPHGFIALVGVFAVLFTVILSLRTWKRHSDAT